MIGKDRLPMHAHHVALKGSRWIVEYKSPDESLLMFQVRAAANGYNTEEIPDGALVRKPNGMYAIHGLDEFQGGDGHLSDEH